VWVSQWLIYGLRERLHRNGPVCLARIRLQTPDDVGCTHRFLYLLPADVSKTHVSHTYSRDRGRVDFSGILHRRSCSERAASM
jgi:hypothetical protein